MPGYRVALTKKGLYDAKIIKVGSVQEAIRNVNTVKCSEERIPKSVSGYVMNERSRRTWKFTCKVDPRFKKEYGIKLELVDAPRRLARLNKYGEPFYKIQPKDTGIIGEIKKIGKQAEKGLEDAADDLVKEIGRLNKYLEDAIATDNQKEIRRLKRKIKRLNNKLEKLKK